MALASMTRHARLMFNIRISPKSGIYGSKNRNFERFHSQERLIFREHRGASFELSNSLIMTGTFDAIFRSQNWATEIVVWWR